MIRRVPPNASPVVLRAEAVSTYFPTARGVVHAVDGVSFELFRGETLGIVGESGSGKSVLARTIMRLTPQAAATDGHVWFDGVDLLGIDRKAGRQLWGRRISMVFQDPMTSLNPVKRIGRPIVETLRVHEHLSKEDATERALELLRQVGIPDVERRFRSHPHELSGGMRQRVGIATAIACHPDVLIADEPTTALDVTIGRQILDLIDDLQADRGMSVILISHDLGVVARRADRVIVMYGGRVVEAGPAERLLAAPQHPYTKALLSSIPRVTQPSHTRLAVLPGRPVDVLDPEPGCRFAPRCARATARCSQADPPLEVVTSPEQLVACFDPLVPSTPGGRS